MQTHYLWCSNVQWHEQDKEKDTRLRSLTLFFPAWPKASELGPHEIKYKNTKDCNAIHTSSHEITYDKKIRNKTDVLILGFCSKLNASPRFMLLLMRILSLQRSNGRFTTLVVFPTFFLKEFLLIGRNLIPGGCQQLYFFWKTSRPLTIFVPLKCYVIIIPTQVSTAKQETSVMWTYKLQHL